MPVKHRFASAKADGGDATLVKPSNWNDTHDGSLSIVAVSANYQGLTTEEVWKCTAGAAGITLTLPDAALCDKTPRWIKRMDAGAGDVTVACTSPDTIDDLTTFVLQNQYQILCIVSDGSNWIILSRWP